MRAPLAEWAGLLPAARHDFVALPLIRSESPVFDLDHACVQSGS
ncbi:hypothetical protein [Streptomyces griseoluteus]